MSAKKGLRSLLSIVLTLCIAVILSVSALASAGSAAEGNDAVEAAKHGVLQVRVGVKDKETNKIVDIQAGTGFLVNASNIVTNHHVVHFDEEAYEWIKENMDLSEKQAEERKVIQISVYRDQVVNAKIYTESEKADLCILQLTDGSLQNKSHLTINTGEVKATAPCYTLGFPWIQVAVNDMSTYTSDDVTVNGGLVNKRASVNTVRYIVHNAQMAEGCSGGPVVNYAGEVIGITKGSVSGDGFQRDYMYAIDVAELVEMMEPLGIEFTKSDGTSIGGGGDDTTGTTTEPEKPEDNKSAVDKSALDAAINEGADTAGHGDAEIQAYNNAFAEAKRVQSDPNADQAAVDKATSDLQSAKEAMLNSRPESRIPYALIIGIAAAIVIILIVIILILGSKKKDKGRDYNIPENIPPYTPPVPPVGGPAYGAPEPNMYAGKPAAGTTVLGGGSTDTTVLSGDNNMTTVLGGGFSYGTLTRVKTGEQIKITNDQFKIGRERNRVDYCISDNTAVGPLHAMIVSRGGSTYVVDHNSTNCTFVNSVRAAANQEVRINDGDKIKFADEDFIYNAL